MQKLCQSTLLAHPRLRRAPRDVAVADRRPGSVRPPLALLHCGAHGPLGTEAKRLGYTLPPFLRYPSDGEKASPTAADLSGPDSRAPGLLGPTGLRAPAAVRHGNGRWHVPHGDVPARHRAGTVERSVRPAVAASH